MGAFTDWIEQPETPAPEPPTTPATEATPPKSRFGSWLDGPTPQDAALGSNLLGAASTTPDAHQKAVDIGRTIGSPADAVAGSKEAEQLARVQRYREALGDAPRLSRLLAEDPDLAKVSADDLDLLGRAEGTLGRLFAAFYGLPAGSGDAAADLGRALPAGALQAVGGSLAGLAEINDLLGRTAGRGLRGIGLGGVADVLAEPAVPWWLNPSGVLRAPGAALKGLGEAVDVDPARRTLATDIAGGVGQVAAQIAAALMTGGASSEALLFGQGADILAGRVAEAGRAGTPEGDAAVAMGGLVTALTEKMGLDALLHRVPPNIRDGILRTLVDIGLGGGIEAVQEVSEGILHNLVAMATVDPDARLLEGVEQDAEAAGGTGAFIRALVNAAAKGRQVQRNERRALRAAQDRAVVEALVEGTADSRLRDRDPDAFAAVMAAQTQGTPVQTFYVPAEAIAELYQDGGPAVDGVDPLDRVEGLREQLAEALAVGGDVEISAADYLAYIAPTELHARLKDDLRASRDGWSVNDATRYAEDPSLEAEVAALVERQAAAAAADAPGQDVFDRAYRDLMDTGRFTSRQAAEQAALTRERFVSRAARFGNADVTPERLYEESRLEILGPAQAGDVAPAGALSQDEPGPVLWHGSTDADLTLEGIRISGRPSKQGKRGRDYGGFYAVGEDQLAAAENYSRMQPGTPTLYRVELKPGTKVLDLERNGEIERLSKARIDELVAQGYGAVRGRNVLGTTTEYAVIDQGAVARIETREAAAARQAAEQELFQRAAKPPPPLGTDPKERAHTVIDILYGDTPALRPNSREVGDIARELMARGSRALRALGVKGGVIEGPGEKTDEIISRAIAAEIKAALAGSTRTASDWYTRKVEEALAIAALMHPEIATDPIAEMGFTAALAITSQGETVPSNVRLADPIYRHFKETGRFPTAVKAKNGPAMAANFEKLNDLLDKHGPEGARAFLHQRFTVGDLKKMGYPIGGENVGTVVWGSAILGPKIGGGFFQNLNRNYSPVTMDLWFMRAWGRLTGTLVGNTNPASLAKQKDRLTAALEAAGRKVPKTDATLEKVAEEIRSAHERDFVKNRAAYDSGEKAKAEIAYAAERYLIGLNGINEQPSSGSERVWMRERVGRAQELLAQEGITLTAADLQAVWWYPEKDLYAKLGGRDSEAINVDYAGALTELARSKGVSDDAIARAVGALDQRSGSARAADDAGAEQGGGRGGEEVHGRAGGAGAGPAAGADVGADLRRDNRGVHAGPPVTYTRTGGGALQGRLVGDVPAVARWEPVGKGPVLFELEPGAAAARLFSAAIRAAKQGNAYGAAVYVYPDEDYAGMRLFVTEDRQAGIALKGDDTVSLFNTDGSPHKGAGVHMVRFAAQEGGRRLDAFDTVLPWIYAKAGFVVAARLPWDESQAPDGWDKALFGEYRGGTPDVVFMAYTGREPPYVEGEGPYAVDYDDAVRLQREAVDAYEASQDPGRDLDGTELFQQQAADAGGGAAGGGDRAAAVPGPVPGEPGATAPDRQGPSRLRNLPASSLGPLQSIRDAAARHMRAMGLPVRTQAEHVVADPARGKRIADAYEAMRHDPQDPEVKAAYRAMIGETLAQYRLVKELGITVEVIEPGMPDPYPGGPREAIADLHRGHLWLYPTDAGFGTLTEITDNPLLEPTQEFIGTRRLVANDVFRIVHDVFGHGKEGVGFGPSGEENAWQSHVLMYSPLAARAMTSETRGQNSWVNFGPYGESNRANQRETVYADQKVGLLPEWASTEAVSAVPAPPGEGLGQGVQGSYRRAQDPYGNPANIIRLTKDSNLSTFLHESGHFYLFQLIDDAFDPRAAPEARAALRADLKVVLDHAGIAVDLSTATADQVHAAMTREAHELWARSFEVYLREGKAPSAALRDAFASFAAWLVRIYKSLSGIPDYRKKLTPQVRGVMDRLLATDEAIADAQAAASFRVPAALKAALTEGERKGMERLADQAAREAREELQKRVMAELERERREWWRDEREKVRAQVEAEVRNRPAYRAYNLLRHGETPDGRPTLDADGNPTTTRLDRGHLVQAYGRDVLKQLPKGVSAERGVSHEVFAGLVGFGSGDALVEALKALAPMRETIDAETDATMKSRHGDMLTDGRIAEDAAEVVLNQHQVELATLQAKALKRLAAGLTKTAKTRIAATEAAQRTGRQEGVRQVRRLQTGLDARAIAAAAKRAVAGKRIEDAVPAKYRAQADRIGREVEVAIAGQDYGLAARLKEQQVVNLALAKEAQDVQARVDKAVKRFARLRKPDSKLAKGTDVDFVGAARAMLGAFGLSSPQGGFDRQVWFTRMAELDPIGAQEMRDMVDAATEGAGRVAARGRTRTRRRPGGAPAAMGEIWRQMTVDEFGSLADTVDGILAMGRAARSVELDGERLEIKAAVGELIAQASGRDTGKRIGQTEAVTPWEKRARSFWGLAAFLERTESWARRMDDGKVGPFTRYLVRPVLAAVYEYRGQKTRRIRQLVDILAPRKAELLGKPIFAPELNYTFQNKGALLHAILHTGNDSNLRKLLLGGRGQGFAWGKAMPDGGVDRSRWDGMVRRLVQEGVLTKQDFDTAQAVWDLLEELKGPAQVAHRKMKGFYFNEVEVTGIDTPFGRYRGGYVPAVSDRTLNPEAGARVDADAMGDMANAGILPSVAKGFTKSRVEYNQPLELNISKLTGHMDTVLKFTHLGPVVRDVTRLATDRGFRSEMFGIDPHAVDEVLVPWLQRVARQTTEIPFTSEGARTFGKFFKALQRNTGIAAMAGNLLNAAQQVTGLSVAMAEVRPTRVLRGLVASVGAPRQSARTILAKSAFMRDRMDNATHELMATLDDLLTDKGRYRRLQDKAGKHAYFAQVFMQNLVDRAVWLGSYEQGVAAGLGDAEAALAADGVVRRTQGSFAPEDVSRVEVQNAFARPFVQFYSYFNAQFNFLRERFDATVRELGWAGGSPRLLYVYLTAAMVPAVLADAMVQAATGQLGDDDDDGLLDDIGELFALSQLRYFAAQVPVLGTLVNFGLHLANDRPYDDRLSVAPVVSQVERLGGVAARLAAGAESTTGRAVQDALLLISMLTGLPLAQAGKPLGYVADVATGEQEGGDAGAWLRGLLTGREAPPR